jgi:MSHA type pilus biogenesis protein MshL
MKDLNIILAIITAFVIAGCATTKEELKKMPVSQLIPKKTTKVSTMDELPVTQMLEEVKEREKLYSLSVKDMELKDVLHVLTNEIPEYNVIVDPDVSGKVTATFKNLTLNKVLDVLLDPLGLEHVIEDNILRISQPKMVSRIFEFTYSTSTRKSSSSVMAVTGAGGEGNTGASFGSVESVETVDVWAEIESGIMALMTPGAGKLAISKRVGYITVTDYRSNMKQIEEYINFFKASVLTQIHIRAKLLEVTLKGGSEFGINWAATLKSIPFFSDNTNPLSIIQSFAPALGQASGPTGESRTGEVAELFQFGKADGHFNYLITALKSQGDVTVLSSPEVSILNGQKAILNSVTQDVYFETQQSAGGAGGVITTTTANSFNYGVFLDVTPHVDMEGMITMDVHPSVSSFIAFRTSGTSSRPAIDTRETQTVVTIKSGETILIAGLIKDDIKSNHSKLPFLGDLPVAGKAFRRETSSDIKTELVILITPTIVGSRAKDFGSIRSKYSLLRKPFTRR